MNTSIVKVEEGTTEEDKDTVIEIKNGNFHWGVLSDNDKKFIEEYSKVLNKGKGGKGGKGGSSKKKG